VRTALQTLSTSVIKTGLLMFYKAKVAVYKTHKRNVGTMWNFLMLNLVVRKVIARL
jgi:hypothetical protein